MKQLLQLKEHISIVSCTIPMIIRCRNEEWNIEAVIKRCPNMEIAKEDLVNNTFVGIAGITALWRQMNCENVCVERC